MNFSHFIATVLVCLCLGTAGSVRADNPEKPMNATEHPRYKENPIYLIFEPYILDVVGHLPPEKSKAIQAMNLQNALKTKASEWRGALRESLALSPTIDIAILDLWYRNQEIAKSQGIEYLPQQFAMNFADEYMKEGSKVDVWLPGALEDAKKRIANYRATHNLR